jgi:membrane protease subunit HflK
MRYFLIVIVVLLLLSLLTGLSMVGPGERAVVRRFGRVLKHKPGPGLYVGLPWGIDRVTTVKVDEVRSVKVGYSPVEEDESGTLAPAGQLLTGDQNVINIQVVVNYAVHEDEVDRFIFQQDQARTLVSRTAESVLAEWVGSRPFDTIFARGKTAQAGAAGGRSFKEFFVQETQKRLEPYQLGVVVQDAQITYLNPPTDVKKAFDAVTSAEKEIQTQVNRAEKDRANLLQEAAAEEYRILQLAQAYATEKILLARADAENFEKQLRQYRELSKTNPYYLNALWWDSMSRLYASMRTNGRIDLLDHHLSDGGLDITHMPPWPGRR